MKKLVSSVLVVCILLTSAFSVFADPGPTSLYYCENGGMMTSVTRSTTTDPDGPGVELEKVAFLTSSQAAAYYYAMTHITWAGNVKNLLRTSGETAALALICDKLKIANPVATTCLSVVVAVVDMELTQQNQINFESAYTGGNPVIIRYYYSYNAVTGALTCKFKEYSRWSGYPWAESPTGYRGTAPVNFSASNMAD